MSLTKRQKAFADYFIETGNASEAARRAGYKGKYPGEAGSENLKKPHISAYIAERMRPTEQKRIASADDVMVFLSDVMRGEVKDQFGLDASLSDRINAAKELMKRHAAAGNALPGADNLEDDPLTRSLREEAQRLANQ